MNDATIFDLAAKHAAYRDAKEITLRSMGIIGFAHDLIAAYQREQADSASEMLLRFDSAVAKVREEMRKDRSATT